MEGATVRSVRVQMNADVAKYIADMRLAGAETRKAFSGTELKGFSRDLAGAERGLSSTNRQLTATSQRMRQVDSDTQRVSQSVRKAGADIDTFSGRLSVMTRMATAIGPAIIPLTAGALPAVTGLAAGLGAAAGAAGVAMLAFHGFGGALKAMDTYQLDPTTANLQKMQQAVAAIGPAGANFAQFVRSLRPELDALRESARDGLFPGLQQGLQELEPLFPKLESFVSSMSREMGNLAAAAGNGLANDAGFQRFFNYLDSDAAPTLDAFARATGKVASGLASLTVAFAPLNRDFTAGMLHAADAFQHWAAGLGQTQGFRDFLTYVEQSGPQVAHLLEAVASAFIGIAKAAAPIGAVTLPLLTDMVNLLAKLANSPLGPLLVAFVSVNSAVSLAGAAVDKLAASWARVTASATEAAAAEEGAAAAGKGAGGAGLGRVAGAAAGAALVGTAVAYAGAKAADNATSNKAAQPYLSLDTMGDWRQLSDLGTAAKTQRVSHLGGLWTTGRTNDQSAMLQTADTTLSQAATQGGPAAAQAAKYFASLGLSASQAAKAFPQYTAAVKTAAGATTGAATAASDARTNITSLTQAMERQRSAALAGFDAQTQYRQAMKDAAAQAEKNDAGIQGSSDAALANRTALSRLAAAWNNQSDAVKNNIAKFDQAQDNFVATAHAMGVPTDAAKRLAGELLDIPKSIVTKVAANTDNAKAQLIALRAYMDTLHDKTITIETRRIDMYGAGNAALNAQHSGRADGGTVPKTGMSYADRHPYLLADGEEVISNRYGQADRHRALLKAINANRLADGGTAGNPRRISNGGTTLLDLGGGPGGMKKALEALENTTAAGILASINKNAPKWKGWTDAELRTIKVAEKANLALDKMKDSTLKQVKAYDKAAQNALTRDKDAADVARQHKDAIQQDMAAIKQQVASRYQSDVFGGVDPTSIAYQIDPKTGKYVNAQQSSVLQVQGVLAGLQKDIANAQAAKTAEATIAAALKKQGFSKDDIDAATLYMSQNASVDQMKALAANPTLAGQYTQLYAQRATASNAAGGVIASQVDGANLASATKSLAALEAQAREAQVRAKAADARANRMEQHVKDLKKKVDTLAKDTGTAVGDKINTALRKGK